MISGAAVEEESRAWAGGRERHADGPVVPATDRARDIATAGRPPHQSRVRIERDEAALPLIATSKGFLLAGAPAGLR
jgi:hypothetical protein